ELFDRRGDFAIRCRVEAVGPADQRRQLRHRSGRGAELEDQGRRRVQVVNTLPPRVVDDQAVLDLVRLEPLGPLETCFLHAVTSRLRGGTPARARARASLARYSPDSGLAPLAISSQRTARAGSPAWSQQVPSNAGANSAKIRRSNASAGCT